ncbi:hypothetical protein BGZ75_009051 [Mortierella antarctica]|nr:hypothetical protein BGZ67_007174 [Mortierella alpina]KAF9979946.1 hypothetical protein BGZ75_009051 [Mortierella antarctica]
MAQFMSMQYDSDSDSADDLDFEPASEASSCSDDESGTDMGDAVNDVGSAAGPAEPGANVPSRPVKKAAVPAAVKPQLAASEAAGVQPPASSESAVGPEVPGMVDGAGPSDAPATEPVVEKKKKGPKKGTKYKKRIPATLDAAGGKAAKPVKMSKKAAAAAAAAAEAEAALRAQQQTLNIGGRFGTRVDLDHPLETFKWPYSPFTSDFMSQHRARDKMASTLHQQVQDMTTRNGQALDYLQELDHQLQLSRQDLRTSLDEIQFRKSQLRDMGLLAVDIVRKLSSSSSSSSTSPRRRLSYSAGSGNESGVGEGCEGGYASSCPTAASHLDGDRMDVDEAEGQQLPPPHQRPPSSRQHSLEGLSEGNVRSFLEKIRELEQAQRHVVL